MAKFVLEEVTTEIDGVDLSANINSVEVSLKYDDLDSTNFSGGGKEHTAGLKDDEIVLNVFQDFSAASVDAVLYPLFANKEEFTVTIKPTTGAISATNPGYTATCILLEYQPLAGKVGELSETKVKIATQRTGITRITS
jgi:hypothetical protein